MNDVQNFVHFSNNMPALPLSLNSTECEMGLLSAITDLASNPSTRLFRRAIVIFDGQKNDHDRFVYRWAK